MPLTSLPTELLLDIAGLLGEPGLDHLNDYSTLVSRRNCLALAATCRATRDVAVNVLYKHIVLDPNQAWIFSLHKILISDPVAASSVRHLILAPPENRRLPGWSSPKELYRGYRQILNACPGVRTLLVTAHINSSLQVQRPSWNNSAGTKRKNFAHAFWKKPGKNMSRLLSSINSSSQKKIEHIEFRKISIRQVWSHIQRLVTFTGLETLIITDCHIDNPNSGNVTDLLNLDLPSILPVKTLSITMQDPDIPFQFDEAILQQEYTIGTLFASSFPDIKTFTLHAAEGIIYGALNKYISIGKNLTHLTICPRVSMFGDTHLCDIFSTLSSSLTHLTISKGNETDFCHKLFAGEWKHLKQLVLNDCSFPYSCSGDSGGLDQLRINLLHLLHSRPAAAIMILGQCVWVHPAACECNMSLRLVWKEKGEKEYFICEDMFDEPSDDESGSESMSDDFIPYTGGFGGPGVFVGPGGLGNFIIPDLL